jgi:hypothetical protein
MAKKTKSANVIDGKVEEPQIQEQVITKLNVTGGKRNVRSIDELLGRTTAAYSTSNIEDYEAKIRNMTLADLQSHAASVGLLPVTNKNTLINRLLGEFKKKSRGFYNTTTFNEIQPKNREKLLKTIQQASGV